MSRADNRAALTNAHRRPGGALDAYHHPCRNTEMSGRLWLEAHLKNNFTFPQTPDLTVDLKGHGGIHQVTVGHRNPVMSAAAPLFVYAQWVVT